MKILLTGGTGFIGSELVKSWNTDDVTLLTRSPEKAKQNLNHLNQNNLHYIQSLDELSNLNDFDVVVNLAGEPIADKRWSEEQKERICSSRWHITEKLVELIHASSNPPEVFISGSAVGYYGDQQQHPFDESLQVEDESFPHKVCAHWEEIAKRAESDNTRVILLRTGIVLGENGGALKKMLMPYKLGVGGPLGSGKQYMPWIHMLDMVRAINHLLSMPHAQGEFNMCAPHPVTNKLFSSTLAKQLGRPHFLFTPKWAMSLLMGESSCLLFDSIRSKPKKLTEMGFIFSYSRIEPALKNLLQHQE
ncbi:MULTISPECIES: TIGR01777 family oxidoreductase [unclassified Vibrio]|uniref:TIGR01777 family oxidoreductase n=1 Tax=unclassified Vibrio TaxID=2614977 RepID=UPI00159D1CC1|nr:MULTISPECIES: TIGR01777 family oxidoreductase [unclassified Vibrio]NVN81698.1 TIGR01777 family protein [Vibrio sp. Scap16]QLE92260.1 TIGR01777 family protein [Vibrio sp. Scap24]